MYRFTIPGLGVDREVSAIRAAVHAIDEQGIVTFDWETRKICIESSADLADLRIVLAALGYRIDAQGSRNTSV